MDNKFGDPRDQRREAATLELARTDPSLLYGQDYYSNYTSDTLIPYGRQEPWLSLFRNVAKNIEQRFRPRTVVDAGCAFGLLVEALCDRGVDGRGFDISDYAVSRARNDMTKRIQVSSIMNPISLIDGQKYDLAICIEVVEHLPPEQAEIAIANICSAADRVLFSSSPDDFVEPTHFNVLPTEQWLSLFAANGFYPADNSKAEFVSKQAFVVENTPALPKVGFWRRFRRS